MKNYTRILNAVLNTSCKQHHQKKAAARLSYFSSHKPFNMNKACKALLEKRRQTHKRCSFKDSNLY